MARSKWDELLSTAPSASRSDVVQQIVQIVSAGSGDSGGARSASGVLGGVTQGSTGEFTEQISSLVTQMGSLASVQQTLAGATQDNTQALTQNTTSKSGTGGSVGSAMGSVASTVLGGSILSPILGGLMDLFGVGDSSQPAVAASPFMLPAPVQYEGGTSSPGQVTPISYGQTGQPRTQAATSAPQVNIQVSAMDSQSFLDHSDEIATAVRNALLNSHPLADVISDL